MVDPGIQAGLSATPELGASRALGATLVSHMWARLLGPPLAHKRVPRYMLTHPHCEHMNTCSRTGAQSFL